MSDVWVTNTVRSKEKITPLTTLMKNLRMTNELRIPFKKLGTES